MNKAADEGTIPPPQPPVSPAPTQVVLDLAAGKCYIPSTIDIPGYLVLSLPFLGAVFAMTPLKSTSLGRFLLHRRLSPISVVAPWVEQATFYVLPIIQALSWGEALMVFSYMAMHLGLLAQWVIQEDAVTALGNAALTNFMMMFVPVSTLRMVVIDNESEGRAACCPLRHSRCPYT